MLNWRTGESVHTDSIPLTAIFILRNVLAISRHSTPDCFTGSQFIILLVLHAGSIDAASPLLVRECAVGVAVREQWRVALQRGLDAMGNGIIDSALAKVLMELYVIITILAKRAPGMKAAAIYYCYYKLN